MKFNVFLVALLFATFFLACEDEKESNNPYVGNWATHSHFGMNANSEVVNQKIEFDFSNTSFEASVFQSDTITSNNLSIYFAGIKGSVADKGNNLMDVSVTDLALMTPTWYNRSTEASVFNGIYGAGVNQMISSLDFEAEYLIEGDLLKLVIPGDTLFLYKQ